MNNIPPEGPSSEPNGDNPSLEETNPANNDQYSPITLAIQDLAQALGMSLAMAQIFYDTYQKVLNEAGVFLYDKKKSN